MRVQVWALGGLCAIAMALPAGAETKQSEQTRASEAIEPVTLNQFDRPATLVKEWMAQVEAAQVKVTGVRVEPAAGTVRVILETSVGISAVPSRRSEENTLVTEIENAVLALPEGNRVAIDKPAEGIRAIEVIQGSPTTVQVRITGATAVPIVEVVPSAEGLVLSAEADEEVAEEEITVTGEGARGYRVPNASTATRTDTLIRDIPASIQVVPRQVIEDRGLTSVANVLENVSGTNAGTYLGTTASPRLRGFASFNSSFFVNGSSRGSVNFDNYNTDNLERIEVLKGPASILFGQGAPGGIINFVTKKPLSEPYYNLGFLAGSFGQIRPNFDISGPLNPEKTVLYRFVGSYERSRSFVEFANSERYFLAPTLEWRISPNTTATIDFEFTDSSTTSIQGIPAAGRGVADIPRSRALSESGDFGDPFGKFNIQRYVLSARLDHQFNQDWSIRNSFISQWITQNNAGPNVSDFDEATGEYSRSVFTRNESRPSFYNNLDLTGNFRTGSIDHKVLVGFEFGRETLERNFSFSEPYPSLNIFDPIYSTQRFRFDSFPFDVRREQTNTTYAVYFQNQIALADDLKIVLGGRYDSYQQRTENRITSTTSELTSSVFSPRVGIVYQPIQPLSLYASFVQGFEPSTAALADGSVPSPQKATQYEVGTKLELGRVTATLAYFDITRTNIPTTDPSNSRFSVLTGEVKSRGLELDITGEILPGWNIIAAYAYTDAFVSRDNIIPIGNRAIFVPRHAASLWTTYQIQKGNLQGLGLGLGLYYVGEREADADNSFAVPSYLRTDASIFYRRDNWRLQLNFQNLFSTEYFVGTNEFRAGGVMPGAPFSVVGSVSVTF